MRHTNFPFLFTFLLAHRLTTMEWQGRFLPTLHAVPHHPRFSRLFPSSLVNEQRWAEEKPRAATLFNVLSFNGCEGLASGSSLCHNSCSVKMRFHE